MEDSIGQQIDRPTTTIITTFISSIIFGAWFFILSECENGLSCIVFANAFTFEFSENFDRYGLFSCPPPIPRPYTPCRTYHTPGLIPNAHEFDILKGENKCI